MIEAVEQPEAASRAGSKAPVPVTLTLKGAGESYEFGIDLETSSLELRLMAARRELKQARSQKCRTNREGHRINLEGGRSGDDGSDG